MGTRLKKAWLWTKLIVIILVVAYVTLFFVRNSGERNRADVWLFFGLNFTQVPLVWIVPITALAAVVVYYIVRKVTGVVHQLSQVKELEKARERERKMEELVRQAEQPESSGPAPTPPEQ